MSPIEELIALYERRRGDRWIVVVPPAVGQPNAALRLIYDHADALTAGVDILGMHSTHIWPYHPNIRLYSTFFSAADRAMYRPSVPGQCPGVQPIDVHFSEMAPMMAGWRPDLVIAQTTPSRNGRRSLGGNADYTLSLIQSGVPVFAVENPRIPWVNGNQFPDEQIVGVMTCDEPLHTAAMKPSKNMDVDGVIADLIADLVRDLAEDRFGGRVRMQTGVGFLPWSVLLQVGGEGLVSGIWSEVVTDAMMALPTGTPIVATLALGSDELFRWLNDNPHVTLLPSAVTNRRDQITEHCDVSINQAMEVTLGGATVVGVGRRYSGTGGQLDFRAAPVSIIALRSSRLVTTSDDDGTTRRLMSNIVVGPGPYDHVVMPPASRPDYVVTEYGVAHIGGQPKLEVTQRLIERCAHPDLRDALWAEAHRGGILPEDRVAAG